LALAAAVFLSGGTLAYAQGTPPDSGQSQKDQTKDQMQQPGSSGDQTKMQQPGARSGAEPRTMPSSEQRPSDRNMQNTQMQGGQGSEREQMQGRDQPQGGQMLRGGEERGEGTRPLSVEQKTTLRDTVLRRGPKLTHVSFRIGVGAVVPRSVRVVAVPQPILAIYPEWAGDLYFVYGDEIVVVAPDSMAIVGVLPL
jgi:hypothetical protein